MQTDEEVGKIALHTPVLVSKCLELFAQELVEKAGVAAQAKNSRSLLPQHVKEVVLSEAAFDFLRDLVQDLPDTEPRVERRGRPPRRGDEDEGENEEQHINHARGSQIDFSPSRTSTPPRPDLRSSGTYKNILPISTTPPRVDTRPSVPISTLDVCPPPVPYTPLPFPNTPPPAPSLRFAPSSPPQFVTREYPPSHPPAPPLPTILPKSTLERQLSTPVSGSGAFNLFGTGPTHGAATPPTMKKPSSIADLLNGDEDNDDSAPSATFTSFVFDTQHHYNPHHQRVTTPSSTPPHHPPPSSAS
eukprot:TRINITY_DN11887_c0_g1_i1.p1 TRINITY_DN11887_c0_g1~~TRINITY_DN11887_c0_g1_i1.p1  ORF type:complete len:354 (+),score=51.99 TRINITY_DN11887_c0_g1_i1:157-1062(+)